MRHIILILAVLLGHPVSAQTLTKAEQGRAAISDCYRQCSFQGYVSGQYIVSYAAQIGTAQAVTAYYGCVALQEHVRNMENCRMECLDLEAVYGTRTSHTRSRFFEFFNSQRKPLVESGLWVDYKRSPDYQDPRELTSFLTACNRHLTRLSASGDEMEDTMQGHDPYAPFTPLVADDELDQVE